MSVRKAAHEVEAALEEVGHHVKPFIEHHWFVMLIILWMSSMFGVGLLWSISPRSITYIVYVMLPMPFAFIGAMLSSAAHKHADIVWLWFAIIANMLAMLFSGAAWHVVAGEMSHCQDVYKETQIMIALQRSSSQMRDVGADAVLQQAATLTARQITAYDNVLCIGIVHESTGWYRAHVGVLIYSCCTNMLCGILLSVMLAMHIPSIHKMYLKLIAYRNRHLSAKQHDH